MEYNFRITASSTPIIGGEGGAVVSVPSQFGLVQAYPNPFNDEVRIDYSVPQGMISLQVYDVLGHVVAELEGGSMSAGSHSITWKAEDVSSGIYFIRLEAAGQIDLMKVALIR